MAGAVDDLVRLFRFAGHLEKPPLVVGHPATLIIDVLCINAVAHSL